MNIEILLTSSFRRRCFQFHLTAIVPCGICDIQRCSMLSQLSFLSYASVRTLRWTKNNSYFDKFTMSAATAYLFVWEFITEDFLLCKIISWYRHCIIHLKFQLGFWQYERKEEEVNFEKTYGGIFNSCY